MTGRYFSIAVIVCLAMATCLALSSRLRAESTYTYNMVNDYHFYEYSGYRAERQYSHLLRIRVVQDMRPEAERRTRRISSTATDDAFWTYPVPEMVERILVREFAMSFLFRKVSREDTKSRLTLELVLKSFHGYMERAGFLARTIHGSVAFSARLIDEDPRTVIFDKDYGYRSRTKLKPVTKSRDHMVTQVARCLEEIVPVLITDVETALKQIRPPQKPQSRPRKKRKPLNLEPVGPK